MISDLQHECGGGFSAGRALGGSILKSWAAGAAGRFLRQDADELVGKQYDFRRRRGALDGLPLALVSGLFASDQECTLRMTIACGTMGRTVWCWRESGLKHVHGTAGYDIQRDGPLRSPGYSYFLPTAHAFDYPMLYVFDQQPVKIEVFSLSCGGSDSKRKQATVVQMHPFGAERLYKI